MVAADEFHRLYYDAGLAGGTWMNTRWLGVSTQKCPLDLWIYQEILHEVGPDWIIESGTADGGSALFLASICDLLDHGRIITIDTEDRARPSHPRIDYFTGSLTDPALVARTRERVGGVVMVILDSDHSLRHVRAELKALAPLVTPGSYLIVEDTNLNGNPVFEDFGPGPMEAVTEFVGEHPEFVADRSREKFLLTFNPRGYLRRVEDD